MRLITALLASAFALSSGAGEAQLLPAGKFSARDGRPGPGKHWNVSDVDGERLAAAITATAAKTPIVIDYDHQTIRAEKNGMVAPAAGWILGAEWRAGKGLFAKVEWTPAARQRIADKEYQYISPVIVSDDDSGQIQGVLLAALVNHPALLGMEPVLAQLSTQFSTQEEPSMALLASLLAALGLPADTTEATALTAVSALKVKAELPPKLPVALATELKLQANAGEAEALSAIKALQSPSTETVQMITALNGQIAALTQQLSGDQVTKAVDDAIKANKLVPAQRDWALSWGKKDLAALQGFIAGAPVIPGLSGQSGGEDRGTTTTALSGDAEAMRAGFGLTAEQWAAAAPKKS